jgi:hypothetical protein
MSVLKNTENWCWFITASTVRLTDTSTDLLEFHVITRKTGRDNGKAKVKMTAKLYHQSSWVRTSLFSQLSTRKCNSDSHWSSALGTATSTPWHSMLPQSVVLDVRRCWKNMNTNWGIRSRRHSPRNMLKTHSRRLFRSTLNQHWFWEIYQLCVTRQVNTKYEWLKW